MPSSVEAAQNARHTSDLMRRFREAGERMRQEYKHPPNLPEEEVRLRVSRLLLFMEESGFLCVQAGGAH